MLKYKGSFFLSVAGEAHFFPALHASRALMGLVAGGTAHAAAAQLVSERSVFDGTMLGMTTQTGSVEGVGEQGQSRFFVFVHFVAIRAGQAPRAGHVLRVNRRRVAREADLLTLKTHRYLDIVDIRIFHMFLIPDVTRRAIDFKYRRMNGFVEKVRNVVVTLQTFFIGYNGFNRILPESVSDQEKEYPKRGVYELVIHFIHPLVRVKLRLP
jgi:hypothetical protein